MIVGICKFKLDLPHLHSLKEKRSLLQRIKHKGMDRFKIAMAEVGDQDVWQTAVLGFSVVGSDENYIRDTIDKLLAFMEESEGVRIGDETIEVLRF